jgi:hypothetical protein
LNSLKQLCSGSLPLAAAFWKYLIIGGLVVALAISAIGAITVIAYPPARVPVYVAGFFVLWIYLAIACLGTWRSAGATKAGSLRIVAKCAVILLAVWFVFILSNKNGVTAMLRGTWQPGSYLKDKP